MLNKWGLRPMKSFRKSKLQPSEVSKTESPLQLFDAQKTI
jgi:hypothetical protein